MCTRGSSWEGPPFASSGAWPGRRVVLCPCVWHPPPRPAPMSSTLSTTPLHPWFLGHRVRVPTAEPTLERCLPASVGLGAGPNLPNLEGRRSHGPRQNSVSSLCGLPGGGEACASLEGQWG